MSKLAEMMARRQLIEKKKNRFFREHFLPWLKNPINSPRIAARIPRKRGK